MLSKKLDAPVTSSKCCQRHVDVMVFTQCSRKETTMDELMELGFIVEETKGSGIRAPYFDGLTCTTVVGPSY